MAGSILVATDEPTILIAEDDRFDQLILKRAFRAAQPGVNLHFVEHGANLLNYMQRCVATPPETTLPSIIFIDLNMPVLDGWKVLEQMRAETRWSNLPIIVMSTLTEQRDIDRIMAQGATHYFTKPLHFQELVNIIKSTATPWLTRGTIS